uniref:Gypsy retrotransposon integrase-like protein 1 n=1 Tax=Leptobrachium leishanense TaxID=445787 RepID=A0A8C5MZM0_9ANUR
MPYPWLKKETPLLVQAIDGRPLETPFVLFESRNITVGIGLCHKESMFFHAISSPSYPIVLGYPWLTRHNPVIDWRARQIAKWDNDCMASCIEIPLSINVLNLPTAPPLTTSIPVPYSDLAPVFDKREADRLPPHRSYDCAIDLLPGTMPPKGAVYPLSVKEHKVLEEYIKDSLNKGFIRPSSSPAGAGFFFVQKKEGDLRPCIDFRGLNKITVKNAYPIPLIPELFDRLKHSKIFSKLDLRGAYNLIRIKHGDEWKTAFNTRLGHYEYLVMPFGLCNAPAVFQAFINDVLREYTPCFVVVYLDDVLIHSPDLNTHHVHVRLVLSKLLANGLYCKLEKCLFDVQQVQFLGYVISSSGFMMDPKKLEAISHWPLPKGLKAIQRFIGFSNYYRRFIKGFSSIIAPITALTRKGGDTQNWSSSALEAFERLKEAFSTAPILHHPDPNRPFVLEVDASETGVGAVLSQRPADDKPMQPCGFYSRKLSPTEARYDIGDRELLAIILALKEWRHLLEGSTCPFSILTDHKNLIYLSEAKRLNPRQARWALFLTRFDFLITYRPGSKNVKADALSRQYEPLATPVSVPVSIVPERKILASLSTRVESPFWNLLLSKQALAPPSKPQNKLFVPSVEVPTALQLFHESKFAGHFGVNKTLDLIKRHLWWPTLTKDVKDYVTTCFVCTRSKSSRLCPAGLLQPLPIPERPWSHLAMDFLVELTPSLGHTVIFVVVDRFSKMAHFIPLKKLPSSSELVQIFTKEIFRLHGVPNVLVSDRGSQFISKFWRGFCHQLGVKLSFSSAYHPQTNGLAERTNQTLETYLRCFISDAQDDWVTLLPWAEFAYNNATSQS